LGIKTLSLPTEIEGLLDNPKELKLHYNILLYSHPFYTLDE
jgi:hypothetical protein